MLSCVPRKDLSMSLLRFCPLLSDILRTFTLMSLEMSQQSSCRL